MARDPKMNSIKTPDLKNLTEEQRQAIAAKDRYTGLSGAKNSGVDFARATKNYNAEIKTHDTKQPRDGAKINEEFTSSKRGSNAAAKGRSTKGAGYKYVGRTRLIKAAVVLAALIAFAVLFAPPIMKGSDYFSQCRSEKLFDEGELSTYRSALAKEHSLYKAKALSSEDNDSYRICCFDIDVTNYGPLAVTIDDIIVSNGGEYADHIVYSCSASGAVEISGFSKETVRVEVLVNMDELSNDQLNTAVTTLKLSTKGMKKKLFGFGLPGVPGFVSVADELTFDPNSDTIYLASRDG